MSEVVRYNLYKIETKQPVDGAQVRFVHSESMTMAYWQFEPGADLPEHSHPNEQITNVMGGSFELTIDGDTLALEAGSVVVIPPNAVHSGRAITGCYVIDAFYPVREDYR
ncbi:Cupin domain protein [Candidatus Methanophagaceae archaeon]|nr:Cupin domain protein [Methanophagales archaeon]